MQKKQDSWSILIWSIFLSMFLSLAFLSVSTKLHSSLKNNNLIQKDIATENEINQILKTQKFESKILPNKTQIIFEKNNQNLNTLSKGETQKIRFFGSWSTTATVKIKQWSEIAYSVILFNNPDYSGTKNVLESDIISTQKDITIPLTPTDQYIEVSLKNLWGYSQYFITSSENFITQDKKYKVLQKIGNKKIEKSYWEIKNF